MANHFTQIAEDAEAVASTFNNPMNQLDTAISTHPHNPAVPNSGGQIDHGFLSNRGVNTHAQIDAHLGSTSNPHATNLTQVAGAGGVAPQVQIGVDLTEATTNDTLSAGSSLTNNLNRIRYQLGQLAGTTWDGVTRSLSGHTHNPAIAGDGGTVVQEGISYDVTRARTREISTLPSIKDNLNEIRADVYDLQQGTGFGTGVITSTHIQNGGLATVDFGDKIVTGAKIADGAVGLLQLGPLLALANSDLSTKSLILNIQPGVFWSDEDSATQITTQTVAWLPSEVPSATDGNRIDVISLNPAGQPVKTLGTPATNPVSPGVPAGNMPICEVYFKGVATGTNVGIYQSPNYPGYVAATDAYIYRDLRPFLNFGGSGGGGGGGGATVLYAAVTDEAPVTIPNSSAVTFLLSNAFIPESTTVTVATSSTTVPDKYTRVPNTPSTNQYCEGDVNGDAPYNRITFGAAPATGSAIRVSYFQGATEPVVNMIWDEVPTGTINGTNLTFTTAYQFQSGSVQVFKGTGSGTLERYQKGVHFNEDAGGTTFTFTSGNAPASGSSLVVSYARGDVGTSNAASVDGFSASATPTAGYLLPLNNDLAFQADITGSAAQLGGFTPSQTPGNNQVPVTGSDGSLTLPGSLNIANNKYVSFAKVTGDPNNAAGIKTDTTTNASRLVLKVGTGGLVVRNNADATDLFAVSNTGALTLTSSITVPNNSFTSYTKNTTGNNSTIGHTTDEYLQLVAGGTGFRIRNNANTLNNLSILDNGNTTVRGTLSAQATTLTTLSTTGAATLASASVTGALSVGGTLTAQAASGSVNGLMSTTHYNALANATTGVVGNTLVLRDGSGHINAAYFNTQANDNLSQTPYMFYGRTAADTYIRTFNPAAITVGYADYAHNAGNATYATTAGNALSSNNATSLSGHVFAKTGALAIGAGQTVTVAHGLNSRPMLVTGFFATGAEGQFALATNSVSFDVNAAAGTVTVYKVDNTNYHIANTRSDTVYVQLNAHRW